MLARILVIAAAVVFSGGQRLEAAPMKVLFWGGQSGIHNPQEQGNRFIAAMKLIGIDVDYAGAMDNTAINDANLVKYDAILSYQQSYSPKITTAQVDALYRFVESGKGLIFAHMSLVASAESDRYNKLIGGYFLDHGNGSYQGQPIQIDSNATEHPAFKGTPVWTAWDETYVNAIYPGSTVLQHRAQQDKGPTDWTWVRNQGAGRVYFTSWGHDSNSWGNAGFIKQLEIALKYVTEPLRGGSTSLERVLIYPDARYTLAAKRQVVNSFVYLNKSAWFSLDGKAQLPHARPTSSH